MVHLIYVAFKVALLTFLTVSHCHNVDVINGNYCFYSAFHFTHVQCFLLGNGPSF